MKNLGFILLIAVVVQSCTGCGERKSAQNRNNKAEEKRIVANKVENERFAFSFLLPNDWVAKDISDNGDGYVIMSPGREDDIRIYGEESTVTEYLPFDQCIASGNFIFSDKEEGTWCKSKDNELFIFRDGDKKRVVFYIKGVEKQTLILNDTLETIAASIEFD
jgi:hypothetical protein